MNSPAQPDFVSDEIVPAGGTWGRIIRLGEVLRIVDLYGQQAVELSLLRRGRPKRPLQCDKHHQDAGECADWEGNRALFGPG